MSLVRTRNNRAMEITDDEPRDDLNRKLRCYHPGCRSPWSVWQEVGYCSLHQWGPHGPVERSKAAEKIRAEIAAAGKPLPL